MVNGKVRSKDDIVKLAEALKQSVSNYLWFKSYYSKYPSEYATHKLKESEDRIILILGSWYSDINLKMTTRRRELVIDIHLNLVAKKSLQTIYITPQELQKKI